MVSSTSHAFDLTLRAAASTNYTLTVMTVVAALLVPVVLAYQAWTYWVFRARLEPRGLRRRRPLSRPDKKAVETWSGADRRLLRATSGARSDLARGPGARWLASAALTVAAAALLATVITAAAERGADLADVRRAAARARRGADRASARHGADRGLGARGAARSLSELREPRSSTCSCGAPGAVGGERTGDLAAVAVQGVDALET